VSDVRGTVQAALAISYTEVTDMTKFASTFLFLFTLIGFTATEALAGTGDPVLLCEQTSTRAIAVDLVNRSKEPFPSTSTYFPDRRNRIMLFGGNLALRSGETVASISATAEDASHRIYPLLVEYTGPMPGQPLVSYVVVRLHDDLRDVGDVLVRVGLRGATSNRVRVAIGYVGGGPVDQWYVSPTATSAGSGSISNPIDLASALNSPKVTPGSTVWLRGGIYRGAFQSTLRGTETAPIVVRQFPGERAIIDGKGFIGPSQNAAFTVYGNWTTYWGFEVMNSSPDRTTKGGTLTRQAGVVVKAPHSKFINLIVHDTGNGFGFWKEAIDSELYGNMIFNCGSEGWHGHGIYTQNDVGLKQINDNVIFNQFGRGLQIYPNPGNTTGYYVEGNIIFNNGVLSSPDTLNNNILAYSYAPFQTSRITLNENYTYSNLTAMLTGGSRDINVMLGNPDLIDNGDLTLTNNYFVGGGPVAAISRWTSLRSTNNTFVGPNTIFSLSLPQETQPQPYGMDSNTFWGGISGYPFWYNGTPLSFSNWKQWTTRDQNSNYTQTSPTGTKIVLRPNKYERGRAHIIVYNWAKSSTVDVDVSSVLGIGAQFEVRNAQDYTGQPILVGTYYGGVLRLPMTGLKVAVPVGFTAAPPPTGPAFNVFVLIER
jgi:hypothetical protein